MRRQLYVAALLVALPLVAFPIVSPPPEAPNDLHHEAVLLEGPNDVNDVEGIPSQYYDNFSERGQQLFDAARAEGEYVVTVGEGAPDFDYDNTSRIAVQYEDQVYQFQTWESPNFPPLNSVLMRLGSLVGGVILGAIGGYGVVNVDG